jgi:hypothetical protein
VPFRATWQMLPVKRNDCEDAPNLGDVVAAILRSMLPLRWNQLRMGLKRKCVPPSARYRAVTVTLFELAPSPTAFTALTVYRYVTPRATERSR